MHSEISLTLEMVESRYSWSLTHVMIQWSPGILKYNEISICRKVFKPAWILEETESIKFREMLETQGYAQAQDVEEREAQSKRSVPLC